MASENLIKVCGDLIYLLTKVITYQHKTWKEARMKMSKSFKNSRLFLAKVPAFSQKQKSDVPPPTKMNKLSGISDQIGQKLSLKTEKIAKIFAKTLTKMGHFSPNIGGIFF